jgi:hypothetical protein
MKAAAVSLASCFGIPGGIALESWLALIMPP